MMLKFYTAAAQAALVLSVFVLAGLLHNSSEAPAIKWTRRADHTEWREHSPSVISKRSTIIFVNIPSCEDPGIPENGVRIGTGFQIGAVIEFACNPGFVLRGTEVLVCGWGELNEPVWDGDPPQCVGELAMGCMHQSGVW